MQERTLPTAFIGYSVDGYPPWSEPFVGWRVDAEISSGLIAEHVRWLAEIEPGETAVRAISAVPVTHEEAVVFLNRTASLTSRTKSVQRTATDEGRMRKVALSQMGECVTRAFRARGDLAGSPAGAGEQDSGESCRD